jgi:hypothetical protein
LGEVNKETHILEEGFFTRISWTAIFSGVTTMLVLIVLFTLLGVGLGAGVIDPLEKRNPFEGLGVGSLVWMMLTMLLAALAGGWMTAHNLSPAQRDAQAAMVHGFLTWATKALIVLVLFAAVIGLGSSHATPLQVAQMQEKGSAEIQEMRRDVRQMVLSMPPSSDKSRKFWSIMEQLIEKGALDPAERADVVTVLSQNPRMTRDEARAMVDRWERRYSHASQRAEENELLLRKAGEEAAGFVSRGALSAFFALLLGALSAILGAWLYVVVEERRRGFSRKATVTI